MFNKVNETDRLAQWVNDVLKGRPESFKKRLLTIFQFSAKMIGNHCKKLQKNS